MTYDPDRYELEEIDEAHEAHERGEHYGAPDPACWACEVDREPECLY